MGKEQISEWATKHDVGMRAVFVPWSQSRNKNEKDDRGRPRRSLNWRVTIHKAQRDILETNYMAGLGHCPAYKKIKRKNEPLVIEWDEVERECENGRSTGEPIMPDLHSVLASLSVDSSVLDYADFEGWARDYGYDADSRKAELIYRQCLEIALKLRNGLGEQALAELAEACQDY